MKIITSKTMLLYLLLSVSCKNTGSKKQENEPVASFSEGEFGYDLQFLKKQDKGLVVLKDGEAQIIISPGYQAKVFTSTADGEGGLSFGWINYKAFGKRADPHMNAFGGENRLWLGPEGGKFSLFFKPGSKMVFDNWKTPAPIDTESWNLKREDSTTVTMYKEMNLVNFQGARLRLMVVRTINILGGQEINRRIGITVNDSVKAVGYETINTLTNQGDLEWTAATGMPCIWMLDMFKPSPSTVIVVPFQHLPGEDFSKLATTNYFGEIPSDRLKHNDSLLVFRADGKNRGKLGITAKRAKPIAGSYDADHKVLTIILFDLYGQVRYLNQEWNITKPSFSGDAVNAYNDGPLTDGTQMGPFYEIESVSPAAFLKPDGSISHKHTVFHFSGNEKELNRVAIRLLGISLENMSKTFSNSN